MDFGKTVVELGHDLNGARILEGGDSSSSTAVVSLMPLKNCLGMYKDASCDRSFSFTIALVPPVFELPKITCLLTRDLPLPPPPQPPAAPPSPPPGFEVDPNLCYLGGHAYFVVPPVKDTLKSHVGMQLWELNVHLNKWLPGLRVVLDFPGGTTSSHPLHVHAVRPAEVAHLLSVTRHSAILELQPTAARDFHFEALGDVNEVRVTCDVGDARPPPPPPPQPPTPPPRLAKSPISDLTIDDFYADEDDSAVPHPTVRQPARERTTDTILGQDDHAKPVQHATVTEYPPPPPPPYKESGSMGFWVTLLLLFGVAVNVVLYQRDPGNYMVMVAKLVRWLRTKANRSVHGRKLLQFVGSTYIGRAVLQCEVRYLGLAGMAPPMGSDDQRHNLLSAPPEDGLKKIRGPRAKPKDKELKELVYTCDEDRALAVDLDEADSMVEEDDHYRNSARDRAKTRLVIKLRKTSHTTSIKLDDVHDMKSLQRKIARICSDLNIDIKGGLLMQYTQANGGIATVSKSTPISNIRSAKELTLLPKNQGTLLPKTQGSRTSRCDNRQLAADLDHD